MQVMPPSRAYLYLFQLAESTPLRAFILPFVMIWLRDRSPNPALVDNALAVMYFTRYYGIQTRSDAEVHEIVRRIRAGSDAETVAHQLSTANFLLQVQLEPETKCPYQFLYSSSMPSYLRTPTNPFLHSLIHEWNKKDHAGNISVSPLSESEEKCKAQYLKPVHAASIVDPRLDEIIPSQWTTVNADDDLMRTLIRACFLHEYDRFTFFHKDYFLDDMLTGSNTFCSSLLVNAILAVGCVSPRISRESLQIHWLLLKLILTVLFDSTARITSQNQQSSGTQIALVIDFLPRRKGYGQLKKPMREA
jgi:hypothetical protein